MLHRQEAEQIISERGWFSLLPNTLRRAILDRASLKVYQAKQPIYHIGDPPGGIYGLIAGGIGISVAPGMHGPYFAHFARSGFWFGEASVISGRPRRVGVVARRKTMLLQLSLSSILELAVSDPTVWRFLALNAVESLDLAISGYDDLMIRQPQTRLMAVLLRLAGYGSDLVTADDALDIDVTQSELAEITGLCRNGVGGILSRLSAAELITAGYRQIRINQPVVLAQMIQDAR